MPNPFLADADLTQALADGVANGDPAELDPKWATVVPDANAWAYGRIVDALVRRGYTVAQLAGDGATTGWLLARQVSIDLGLYRCYLRGAGLAAFNAAMIDDLYKPDDLADMQVVGFDGGVMVPAAPAAGPGVVLGGRMGGTWTPDDARTFGRPYPGRP